MTAIPGNPSGLRTIAALWSTAAEIDISTMNELLAVGVSAWDAVTGAESAPAFASAVTAPAGSLDGAGRLVASACTVLTTYADALETEQRNWAAAQTVLGLSLPEHTIGSVMSPWRTGLDGLNNVGLGGLDDTSGLDLVMQKARAVADQGAAQAAYIAARDTAVIQMSTIAAQLELLATRTVAAGATPSAAVSAPPIGRVGAGPGPGTLFLPSALPNGRPPAEKASWFNDLTTTEQRDLITGNPVWVGGADGLPAWARDQANQILLAQDLDRQDSTLAGLGLDRSAVDTEEEAAQVAQRLRASGWSETEVNTMLTTWAVANQLQTARDRNPDRPVQLIIYEPEAYDGRGRLMASLGDLDSAPDVAVSVPGTTARGYDYVDNQMEDAENLYASATDAGLDAAVVLYLGYRAPDIDVTEMGSMGMVEDGARVLASDMNALLASRQDDDPNLAVIGHSFGAAVVSSAATVGMSADVVILGGSPGGGLAKSVADMTGVDPSKVYVLSSDNDLVTEVGHYGTLGPDPAHRDFGAVRLDSGTGKLFWDHFELYTPGAVTLHNMTMAFANRPQDLILDTPRTRHKHPNSHYPR